MPAPVKYKPCAYCNNAINPKVLGRDGMVWLKCCGCGAQTPAFVQQRARDAAKYWNAMQRIK